MDIQQQAGVASTPGIVASITDDDTAKWTWLILMVAIAFLVVMGRVFNR